MNTAGPILVVDDDPVTLAIFRDILVAEGYGVAIAADAESGLAAVEAAHPAAVVLDLRLPLADGLEFLRRLRAAASHASIPVAIVTGDYLLDEQVAKSINAHGAQIHFKPLWADDLLRLVGRLLSMPESMRN